MSNGKTFFTNEPGNDLYSRFNKLLQDTKCEWFDVLVGYFRTSGFFRLCKAMENIKQIRILVGLNTDNMTYKMVNGAIIYNNPTIKEAKESFQNSVKNEYAASEDSYDVKEGALKFQEWIKTGKLQIRMYPESKLHAKLYIARRKEGDTYPGSVITGSSNFSQSGLIGNLEFNVELRDDSDIEFALETFEELWAKSIDLKEEFIDTVSKETWLKDDITPYEIYLKTLYEYFKEEINDDSDKADDLPLSYMKLRYQTDAVIQAEKRLKAYNGVFVSDVVGLGKTYICALLAKRLKGGKKLFICPPVLIEYWRDVLQEFDVAAQVESLGMLDRLLDKGVDDIKYVFIDEAHRFRNEKTESFSKLQQICRGKKVILISATPINNYNSDIASQIYLFQQKRNCTIIPNNRNIEGFFSKLDGSLHSYKKGTPEYMEQLRKNSEEIRDKVLRQIMIRRTRNEISEYYADDLKNQHMSFPKLGSPEKIEYVFTEEVDRIFKETINIISKFNYARYTPLIYLNDTKEYSQMLVAQKNMGGFMKGILVKRLESSFYAFKKTLGRFIESYQKFINMYKNGEVYISKKIDVYDFIDSDNTAELEKMAEKGDLLHFKSKEFQDRFLKDLESDLSNLDYLKGRWDSIKEDPKLTQFKKELTGNEILKGKKIIVFTESKETAEYIGKELKCIYGDRVISFSGESNETLKLEIEKSFNPKYEGRHEEKYDMLVTTDVLAEGINLHRSNVIVNYDLPWNPTRIMQRAGRINRVGTKFDRIYIFNFFPTAQSDKQLPMEERILEKLQAFHDILGDDFKYLSDEEVTSPKKLFDNLTKNLDDDGESSINPELKYLTIIRKIRDTDEKLFTKIKKMPKKAMSGKKHIKIEKTSTISFIRKGALKRFFIANDKECNEMLFMEAIQYIEALPDEKREKIDKNYFDLLNKNKTAFDELLNNNEDAVTLEKPVIKGNDAKIIKYLRALLSSQKFTDIEEKKMNDTIQLLESGSINDHIGKVINKKLKGVEDPIIAYKTIISEIPESFFMSKKDENLVIQGDREVVLSCYLKKGDK